MKTIELSERELETLMALLNVEESDLTTIQSQLKKRGQEQDLTDVNVELAIISGLLKKVRSAYYG